MGGCCRVAWQKCLHCSIVKRPPVMPALQGKSEGARGMYLLSQCLA